MLASVVVLVMALCASAFAGLKSGSWSLNPADFRYDMSLYFSLADRSLEDLDSYEIGAFVDDECRGLAEKLELTGGESCLYMRIRSNSAQGAKIEFLLRHKATGECVVLKPENGDDFIFKANDRVGMPSAPFVLARFFNVEIAAGENGSVDFEDGLYKEGSQLSVEAVPNEGYHFNEWSDGDKEAKRSITVTGDLSLEASFDVNIYKAVFTIDGEEFQTIEVAYGDEIKAPEVPEKDGYSFAGWSDLPETMPAHDIVVNGTYTINKYKVVFKIDGEEFQTLDYAFGETIEAPEAPIKEGYSFGGWSDLPETMPDHDIEVTGSYIINVYKAVFKIDGEEIASMELEYGAPLEAPAVEEKEGYSFNGWGDLPATMPAHDLEMHSTYIVNVYSLSFSIDGETVFSSEVPFGASIIAPEAPAKEGYTFSGWGEVPEVMPARDLKFESSYIVNAYTVTYVIDGEIAYSAKVNYGEAVPEFNAPAKEGYSFSGWSEIPASMPDHDVEINGSYTLDSYTITFRIGEDVIASNVLPFGTEIQAPEAPAKEGYTFSGWSEIPSTMPAQDVVVTGDYTVNVYTVTYIIDNEVIEVQEYEYGAPIVPIEVPDKEGHSFSGWGDVPATMPAFDLVLGGTFADNYYTVTFRVDGVMIFTDDLVYGASIMVPEAPAKEGYTFNGWGEVPATMPASNLDFEGSYAVNLYKLTFRIGDEVIYEGEIPYGSEIVAPEAPVKDGHSFTGWGVVPVTMPASDLEITGAYEVNSYSLTFMLDDTVYFTTQLGYGSEIVAPEAPSKEGHTFSGWSELPELMPAYDLVVAGTFNVNSYNLTFRIGDEVVFSGLLNYGGEITVPEAPAKEGHTFAGWGVVPPVMPASDLEIVGSYDVNVYNLTFDIDGEIYFTTQLAYGTEISVPTDIPEKDGNTFMGWGNVPATMPAYDLVISGTYAVNHYTLTFRIGEEILFTGEQPFGSDIVAPEAPEKEGYSFSGWGDVPATMPARNIEFEGSYEANLYEHVSYTQMTMPTNNR
ncbi:MAG: InlB B-repeat-containing protein, partial [Muribaculaceae bacterium]|nr:InlB B-repeat-containing protein [Muribaculaceae bacterium]